MKLFKINSEWDLGYEDELFKSKDAALKSLKENKTVEDLCDDGDTLESLMEDGYITIEPVKVNN